MPADTDEMANLRKRRDVLMACLTAIDGMDPGGEDGGEAEARIVKTLAAYYGVDLTGEQETDR